MSDRLFQWWRRVQFRAGKRILFLLARFVHRLPVGMAMGLGRAMGWLAPRISRRHFRRIAADVPRVLGEDASRQEVARVIYDFYRNSGENLIEFLRMSHMSNEDIRRLVRLEGTEHLDAALAQGKGVICMSAHIGNFELLSAAMGLSGYPTSDVARAQKDSQMTEFFRVIREKHGLRLIASEDVRGCLRALKRNECLGLLSDANAPAPGAFVNFFGYPAATYIGAAYFAQATGAPVVPVFIERESPRSHVVRIGPVIPLVTTGDKKKDLLLNTIRLQQYIEREIHRRPADWYWLVRRWKTRPENVTNLERVLVEERDLTPEEAALARDIPRE